MNTYSFRIRKVSIQLARIYTGCNNVLKIFPSNNAWTFNIVSEKLII